MRRMVIIIGILFLSGYFAIPSYGYASTLPHASPFYGAACGSSTLFLEEMAHFLTSNGEEWVYYMPTCANDDCGPWMQENIPSGIYKWPVTGGYMINHASLVYPYKLVNGLWGFQNCTQSTGYVTDLIALSAEAVNPFDLSDTWSANTTFEASSSLLEMVLPAIVSSSVTSLWLPCSSCGYSGPYDREWHGDNTSHLGQDYPAFVNDPVRAIADGQVYHVYTSIDGFGGDNPSRPGPAIVIRHKKGDGTIFFALYGHVLSNLSEGDFVKRKDIVGKVQDYIYGTEHWPHLHFGIWDAPTNFPTNELGYGSDRNFVNPVPFLEKTRCRQWSE